MPYGLRGGPIPFPMPDQFLHPEAIDWVRRASAGGGSVSLATTRAVSSFCHAIDRAGIRDRFLRLNLFCGNSDPNLVAVRTPLYCGASQGGTQLGNAIDGNFNFVAGDYQETGAGGGLKGNGSTKHLATGFNYDNIPSASSTHLSFSGTSIETAVNDRMALGTFLGLGNLVFVMDITTGGGASRGFRSTFTNQALFAHAGDTAESHLIGTRTSSTSTAVYRGGALAVVGAAGTASTQTSNAQIPAFAATNTANAIGQYTSARLRMYSIGNGLNAAQAFSFSSAVIAFNTALGRA
jgi:hypothetical protein